MEAPKATDKRQLILDAALELFVERHFHGTSVPAIARRAGVADGTIYRYFESKESLVNELYLQKKYELVAFVTRPFDEGMSVRDRLIELGIRFMLFTEANPKVIYFLERNHHESYLTDAAKLAELPVVEMIVGILEEGKAQGIVKRIRNEVLMFILYGALGGMVEAKRRGFIDCLSDVREDVELCLWHAIRA